MKVVIGSVHRAGSNYLASVLDKAIDRFDVSGEDMKYISKYRGDFDGYKDYVQKYIDKSPENFIHISPQFTYLAKELELDKVAFLIRDPYEHCLSKINLNSDWKDKLLDALISDLDLFYGYIAKGRNKVFKYENLDSKGIGVICKWLGVEFDLSDIDLSERINEDNRNYKSLEDAISDKKKLSELMSKIEKYQKKFKY
jgi:hypothetical protein